MKKVLFFLFLFCLFAFPKPSLAGFIGCQRINQLGNICQTTTTEAIVPVSGGQVNITGTVPGTVEPEYIPEEKFTTDTITTTVCTSRDLVRLIDNIIVFLTFCVAPWAAVFGFAIGGYNLMLAGGDPAKIETGKRIIMGSVIGLFIALGAGAVLNTALQALGAPPIL
ncbi:hypothetical protein H5T58_01010 [Candidatus Parcubacteria bacterium]|nr:hypothetical protein [Candidatus Parcubacteria bacterium]